MPSTHVSHLSARAAAITAPRGTPASAPGASPTASPTAAPTRLGLLIFGLVLALTVIPRGPLAAQRAGQMNGPVSVGGAINISQPRGVFDQTTNIGWGLSGNVLFRLEPNALLNWRADAAFQNYGNVRQRVPLSNTVGNLIRVDLNTSNNIFSFLTGPQLLGPTGTVMPYVTALGGFSAFWTNSSIEGTNEVQSFASTTNSSDFAWAYGGAVGSYIRLTNGERPIRLDLGVRYLRHDDVTYLTNGEVRAAIDQSRDPRPIRSRVDFYTYFVGVQAVVF